MENLNIRELKDNQLVQCINCGYVNTAEVWKDNARRCCICYSEACGLFPTKIRERDPRVNMTQTEISVNQKASLI